MLTTLSDETRRARRAWRCELCFTRIAAGDFYHAQSNVYDGRVYTFRTCLACERDGVCAYASQVADDDGATYEEAEEWATDAAGWKPVVWGRTGPFAIHGPFAIRSEQQQAARNYLARRCVAVDDTLHAAEGN